MNPVISQITFNILYKENLLSKVDCKLVHRGPKPVQMDSPLYNIVPIHYTVQTWQDHHGGNRRAPSQNFLVCMDFWYHNYSQVLHRVAELAQALAWWSWAALVEWSWAALAGWSLVPLAWWSWAALAGWSWVLWVLWSLVLLVEWSWAPLA